MSRDENYSPFNGPMMTAVSRPGELLFEFLRGHDRFRCELRDHGAYGVEAQFFKNDEFDIAHTFPPWLDRTRTSREMAIAWACEWRRDLERDAAKN